MSWPRSTPGSDVHARLLLALPLFIEAELIVHRRMRLVVAQFVKRGLVSDDTRWKFDAAIASNPPAHQPRPLSEMTWRELTIAMDEADSRSQLYWIRFCF
jgi:hypothetical protein